MGLLTEEDEKRLNERLGVFYTIRICGHVVKINHCLVARVFIGFFIVMATLHIIYITTVLGPAH